MTTAFPTRRSSVSGVGTPRPPQPVRADYGRAFRAHRFDLLVENGTLVGLVETVAEGDELLIVNVAVHPDRQGEGHGLRLLRHAEDLARADKLKSMRLYTNKLMAGNIALYERLAYEIGRASCRERV